MLQTVLIDVNVLVAAHRQDHPQHLISVGWVNANTGKEGNRPDVFITVTIISAFIRLVTNSRIFPQPSSSSEAIDFVDWLLEDAGVQLIEKTNEWPLFKELIIGKDIVVNAVPDAHLAALVLSRSEPFVTFDKGFRTLLPRSLLVLLPSH